MSMRAAGPLLDRVGSERLTECLGRDRLVRPCRHPGIDLTAEPACPQLVEDAVDPTGALDRLP